MKPITSILVDVDATAAAQPALDRAAGIARAIGARLRIVDVRSDFGGARPILRPDIDDELIGSRHSQLERLAYGVRDVPVETEFLAGPPVEALIHDVLRFGHGLVVRSRTRDLVEPRLGQLKNVDAQLIRSCPCPVWAVGHGVSPQNPRIVAAVDASVEDPVKQRLNANVVELAILWAVMLRGTVTLLQVWQPFAEKRARYYGTSDEFSAYTDRARQRAKHDLTSLALRYELMCPSIELRRGEPEAVIPHFVVCEGVDLLVVGTTGRVGFARRLMRTTVERLIQKVPCSVLVTKPDGFVSSVRLRRSA